MNTRQKVLYSLARSDKLNQELRLYCILYLFDEGCLSIHKAFDLCEEAKILSKSEIELDSDITELFYQTYINIDVS
jgi:hypothetical protein